MRAGQRNVDVTRVRITDAGQARWRSAASLAYPTLILRRVTGRRHHHDYDVFDGDHDVGRIYLVDNYGRWFWGSNIQITGRKSYGFATSLEAAKTAFKAQYLAWKSGT